MGRIGMALLHATAALMVTAAPSPAADTHAPTAVLDAPATVGFGDPIPFSGSRSTDAGGGRVVQWRWTVAGRAVVVTSTPTFNAPAGTPPLAPGRYTASLVVVDDSANQSASTSATFVVVDDKAPTAVLDAPTSVSNTAELSLSGSRSSDIGGRVIEYRWTVGSRPEVATSDATFKSPPGLPPGRITAELVVVDDAGNVSAPTSASVVVRDDIAPTAVIEAPRSVAVGDRIPLDASKSTDVGGRVIDYTWTIDSGTPVRVSDPLFNAPAQSPGRHTV